MMSLAQKKSYNPSIRTVHDSVIGAHKNVTQSQGQQVVQPAGVTTHNYHSGMQSLLH